MLLAIDPGADSGWAVFFGRMLVECGLGDSPRFDALRTAQLDNLVIERPVIYPGGRTKSPNDVVTLALNAGEWAGRYKGIGTRVRYVEPRTWKGTLDPDVCNVRILACLDSGETDVYRDATRKVPKRKQHNVIDAIGIGLYACGRFGR
jgi:hypothetical protein